MEMADKVVFIIVITLKLFRCEMEPFAVNGVVTKISHFPHAVRLSALCGGSSTLVWICGASILTHKLLLTAGHCVYACNNSAHSITAYAGQDDTSKLGVVRQVYKAIWHPNFDITTLVNDVALLRLKLDLPFNDKMKRVMITQKCPAVSVGYIAGWGVVNVKTKMLSNQLMSVSQWVRKPETCRHLGALHRGMFCAGSLYTNVNIPRPSLGDSGSGFVASNQIHHQIGILSWTNSNFPALEVYTNISYYYKWIKKRARSLVCHERN